MKVLHTKHYLIALFSVWTLISAFFFIFEYQETKSGTEQVTKKEIVFQSDKNTALHQYIANHQKRNFVIFSVLWLFSVAGSFLGYRIIKNQREAYSEKESNLINSETKFKNYFTDNLAVMLLVDPLTKRISDANNAAIDYYGHPREDFLKMTVYDINLTSVDEINEKMKVAIMQKANHLGFKHQLANQEIRDVEVYASPFIFGNKKMMSIIVHDVTEQKKAQRALINSKKRLQETSKLLETLFDVIPDIISIHDESRNIIRYNKAGYDFFNLTLEQIIGKNCHELLNCKLSYEKCIVNSVYETKKTVKTERFNKESNIWFEVRAYPIFNESGEIYRVMEVLQDITERKNFIDELSKSKERAEESDRLKSSFLANMSHEIRTPMNAILGFTELLMPDTVTPENKRAYGRIIKNSGNHLLDIINDIIDISKIDAKQTSLHETSFDLNMLLFETYQFFQSLIVEKDNKKIQLVLNIDKTNHQNFIFTDKKRLKQILINLIGNAIKFTDKGSIEISYELKTDNTILFIIKDTGIGISEDELQFIFDRFRQGNETYNRVFGGTGLGLAISKEFVELLGGKIWVESEKAKGSSFYFTLPAKPNPETKQSSISTKQEVTKPKNIKNKTILIVEDEKYSLLILEELLKPSGVNILTANDGLQAIQMYIDHKEIDLILMDIQLPKLDGTQATQRIKKINPELPIIAQTAHAIHEEKQKAMSVGFSDYLTKPIDSKKLISLIHKYLS